MYVRLPKQDRATVRVAFQCGINVRLVLRYYSDTNQFDPLIASDPDNEKTGHRLKRLYDIHENGRDWIVFFDEYYHVDEQGHRCDVLVYVSENRDSYDIRIKLHEIKEHEE